MHLLTLPGGAGKAMKGKMVYRAITIFYHNTSLRIVWEMEINTDTSYMYIQRRSRKSRSVTEDSPT